MKKSNIEMVKDYLEGNRPVIQIGYESTDKPRAIGEMWTDISGVTWQQRSGYRVNVNPQANLLRELIRRICKTCKKEVEWGTHLDQKMYKMTENCMDCQIKEETKMRINGTFELYEKRKIRFNQLSYLEDMMRNVRDQYAKANDDISFQNVINDTKVDEEKWSGLDKVELKKSLKKDYRMIFTEVLKIKKDIKLLNEEFSAKK